MEQAQCLHDAEGRDYYIKCFSYSNTAFPEESVVLGSLNGNLVSPDLAKQKITKEVLAYFVISIRSETLTFGRYQELIGGLILWIPWTVGDLGRGLFWFFMVMEVQPGPDERVDHAATDKGQRKI